MNAAFMQANFFKGVQAKQSVSNTIDEEMFEKCIFMSRTCPEIRSCLAYLKSNILAKGVELTRENEHTTPEFHAHLQEYYVRFCSDAIDMAMVCGVVPYILVKSTSATHGYGYPLVLKADTGRIQVSYKDNGSVQYSYEMHGDFDSKRVRVFFEVFTDLGKNGDISSVISSLIPAFDFVHAQEINTFIANEMNARPPVFLTTGSDTFTDKEVVNRDVYGGGVVAEQEFHSQLMRNRIQLNVVQAQKTYLKYMNSDGASMDAPDFFGSTRDRMSGFPVVDYTRGTSYQPEFVPLPNDCAPTQASMPRAPDAIQMHREHFKTLVCMSFAIPSGVLSGSISSSNMSGETSSFLQGSLKHTFEFMKTKLANMSLKAYRLLHNDASFHVKVLFPSLTNMSIYEKLFREGILNRSSYIEQISKTYDIPMSSFEVETHPPVAPAAAPKAQIADDDVGAYEEEQTAKRRKWIERVHEPNLRGSNCSFPVNKSILLV
jgi:hypothetical protein